MKKKITIIVAVAMAFFASCEKDTSDELKAVFSFDPQTGNIGTVFNFDASSSKGATQYQWDWNNDGVWDEGYSTNSTISHQFSESGDITVKLGILGSDGATNTTTSKVHVELGAAPSLTKKFYLQAKINSNKWETVQKDAPGHSSSNTGVATMLTPYVVAIDFNKNYTNADIMALQGKTLSFSSSSSPQAEILVGIGSGIYLTAQDAQDQTGSEFKVTSVTSDGTYFGKASYIVKGTFKCKMDDEDHNNLRTLTDGKFSIRVFDDY